jgi:hypothetical protein
MESFIETLTESHYRYSQCSQMDSMGSDRLGINRIVSNRDRQNSSSNRRIAGALGSDPKGEKSDRSLDPFPIEKN